jgi:hypothetical protein
VAPARELHALGGVLSIERVGILDMKICVEQFVRVPPSDANVGGPRKRFALPHRNQQMWDNRDLQSFLELRLKFEVQTSV